jgi:hypothetical protein
MVREFDCNRLYANRESHSSYDVESHFVINLRK